MGGNPQTSWRASAIRPTAGGHSQFHREWVGILKPCGAQAPSVPPQVAIRSFRDPQRQVLVAGVEFHREWMGIHEPPLAAASIVFRTQSQMRNRVPQDLIVYRYQNQPFKLCLRHKQPVERIAVQLWKRSRPLRLLHGNRQRGETMSRDSLSQPSDKIQLSQSPFYCNFPDRYRADKDFVKRRGNRRMESCRQGCVRCVPPKESMRVQKQSHWLYPKVAQHIFRQRGVEVTGDIGNPEQVLS
jgi:hypothetical protein